MAGDVQRRRIEAARWQVAPFELIGRKKVQINFQLVFANRFRVAIRRRGASAFAAFGFACGAAFTNSNTKIANEAQQINIRRIV